jgi:Leucine-rich repeat (LRR) protein
LWGVFGFFEMKTFLLRLLGVGLGLNALGASIFPIVAQAKSNPSKPATKPNSKATKSVQPAKPVKANAHPFGKWCLGYGGLDRDRQRTVEALAKVAGSRECDRMVASLTKLKVLDLTGAGIFDLEPIGDLNQLESLVLSRNNMVDLAPVAKLTKLKSLVIRGSRVKELNPIAGLGELRRVIVEDSRVEDLSPLRNLRKVGEVSIAGNPIKDLSPLAALGELTKLNANRTLVDDLSPLTSLQFLTELRLDGTSVQGVRPIVGLMGLQVLTLNETPLELSGIADLGVFVNLKRLEVLGIPMKTNPCPKMRSGSVCLYHQG